MADQYEEPIASRMVTPPLEEENSGHVTYDPLDDLIFREVSARDVHVFYSPSVSDSSKATFQIPNYKTDTGMPKNWTLNEMLVPQMFYEHQPYLGFVPVEDVFEGPIFGRFRGNSSYFATKVVSCGLDFQFDPALASSWIRVQNAITSLIADFHVRLKPLDLEHDPYPTDTKFFLPRPSVDRVVKSVLFAQKLVIKLIAELRYSICVSAHVQEESWVETTKRLRFAKTVNCSWLSDLAASRAMTAERLAGVVFSANLMPGPALIKRFIRHNCPVYIPIVCVSRSILADIQPVIHGPIVSIFALIEKDQEKEALPFHVYDALVRVREEWDAFYRTIYLNLPYQLGVLPTIETEPILEAPVPEPTGVGFSPLAQYPPHPNDELDSPQSPDFEYTEGELPAPIPGTRQLPGEWWYDFYKHAKWLQTAPFVEKLDDFEKEQQAIIIHMAEQLRVLEDIPANTVGVFYVWEPTAQHPTFLLRRRVEDHELRQIWRATPCSNRVFNPGMHEWDLYHPSCNMLTLTCKSIPENEQQGHDIELSPSAAPSADSVCQDISQDATLMKKMRLEEVLSQRRRLFCEGEPVQYASRRFGFVFPQSPLPKHPGDNVAKWYFLLGFKDVPISEEAAGQLNEMLTCLKTGHTEHIRSFLDIYVDPDYIIDRNDLILRHIPGAEFKYAKPPSTRNLYIIAFRRDNRQDWLLGVSQAQDIVFAMREGKATSRDTLVEFFLENGIQFYMLAPILSKAAEEVKFPEPCQLPMEPLMKQYTMTHLYEYEKRREEFLDSPYGRIASRSGGVIARLWRRDTSKFRERMHGVNLGPTERAFFKGIRIRCGPDEEFYDDELTDVMESYICGQYLARKSEFNLFIELC